MNTQIQGLSDAQIQKRIAQGAINTRPRTLTRSIPRIIWDNTFTFFNILNLVLFLLVITAGEYKNGLFFLVSVANTIIGAGQEIRAKIMIDRLAVITQSHARVIRAGREHSIAQEEVVLGDTLHLVSGNQVCADGAVLTAEYLEVDESLLTGEATPVVKRQGDQVLSGSFVVAGSGYVQTTAVGVDSYAHSISVQVRYEKKSNSQLMRTIRFIIKSLTFAIVPLGVLLFGRTYLALADYPTALVGAVAAAIGMVPEGLVLLTGIAFALGAFRLVRHRTLTQSVPSIETLARVDMLCLDKTGTITDGTLRVREIVALDGTQEEAVAALQELVASTSDTGQTMDALRQRLPGEGTWSKEQTVAFSSARKWSGATFADHGSLVLGAPEFVLPRLNGILREHIARYTARGLRVLLLARSKNALPDTGRLPDDLCAFALVVLVDHVRESARDTFAFFRENDVEIKVISGDDPQTVAMIAASAGIDNATSCIDMSTITPQDSLDELTARYTVFGRTSPAQKQEMVQALKRAGKIVGMTGDGVNDALALRQADVAVAMASGSDAARTIADFILVDSDFSSMVQVVREGRRVVNNIESVASLYVVKTVYSLLLTLLFLFLPFRYPFQPIQLTLLNVCMVGLSSFFLTFEPNYHPMHNRFAHQLIKDAIPAALLITFNALAIQVAGLFLPLSALHLSTLSVLLSGVAYILLLLRVCRPYTPFKIAMIIVLVAGYFFGFFLMHGFFELSSIFNHLAWVWVPLTGVAYPLYRGLTALAVRFETRFYQKPR